MITETVMCLVLRCNRCNEPLIDTDETDQVIHWDNRADISKAFAENAKLHGWRQFGDRIVCDECQTDDDEPCEREPLPPIDEAAINRAQALRDAGMLAVIWPNQVRAWLREQPETPLRRAVQAAIEAAFENGLENWGPRAGSKAEGEYERAHAVFYAVEHELRPSIATSVMEAAQ